MRVRRWPWYCRTLTQCFDIISGNISLVAFPVSSTNSPPKILPKTLGPINVNVGPQMVRKPSNVRIWKFTKYGWSHILVNFSSQSFLKVLFLSECNWLNLEKKKGSLQCLIFICWTLDSGYVIRFALYVRLFLSLFG